MQELLPHQFTDRLTPLFEGVVREGGKKLDPGFFGRWRESMESGLARTWETGGCVLGALFVNDLFTNDFRAFVVFWFADPAVRGTALPGRLFRLFEAAARDAGCVDIQSAAHQSFQPVSRKLGYLKHGFHMSETVFCKTL